MQLVYKQLRLIERQQVMLQVLAKRERSYRGVENSSVLLALPSEFTAANHGAKFMRGGPPSHYVMPARRPGVLCKYPPGPSGGRPQYRGRG